MKIITFVVALFFTANLSAAVATAAEEKEVLAAMYAFAEAIAKHDVPALQRFMHDELIVFSAGLDGTLRAFSSFDGRPIWQYNTAKDFETVNGVKARGGSIGSAGATIVNGMVYVTSGYTGFQNGRPGNVLLAFAPSAVQ
jgi:outer membrane protein assembly factor BamB